MKLFFRLLLFMVLVAAKLSGQSEYFLEIIPIDKDSFFLTKNISFNRSFEDQTDLNDEITDLLGQLYDLGYLSASVDSLVRLDSLRRAYLFCGEKYEWATLKNGNVDPEFLDQIGFKEKLYSGKPFHYKEVRLLLDKLIKQAENHGYPFASARLTELRIEGSKISASVSLRKNSMITIEGIETHGEGRISDRYLQSYLGIKPGSPYDESKILSIRKRIKELSFLKESQSLKVTFIEDKATVNVFLNNQKSSRFDFLIGFLPKSEETGKLILTGNAEIDLKNPFGTGKAIRLNWQQLRPGTQELNVHFLYPYVLGLPFGAEFNFDLYKRDSSYLNLDRDIGVQYHLDGSNYLKAFWNNKRSTTLSINEELIRNSRKLPKNLDVSHETFGIEYVMDRLDYRFNPTKGFSLRLRGGAGVKRILKNNRIEEIEDPDEPSFDYASLYDSLQLKTFRFQLTGTLNWFFPIGNRSAIKAGVTGGYLNSGETNYENELFRIGGARLLRGFDEESVLASLYTIFTAEYRLIIGQNSYIYAFGDYGYVQNRSLDSNVEDDPLGFGLGLTFETKAGIFGLSYALGRQLGNPIDPRSGKIHFGYINFF